MEDSEGTVRQIGAFSEGINNLTVSEISPPNQTLHLVFVLSTISLSAQNAICSQNALTCLTDILSLIFHHIGVAVLIGQDSLSHTVF